MSEEGLWTESFHVTWKPSLRYHDHWATFMRSLEDSGRLLAFAVGDATRVLARLSEHHLLEFGPAGMSIQNILRGSRDKILPYQVAADLLDVLAPEQTTVSVAGYQDIRGLGFDEPPAGMNRFVDAMLGPSFTEHPGADAAVLLDGSAGEGRDYLVEFGIISPEEALDRLTRRLGRAAIREQWGPLAGVIEDLEVPPVGMFSDWSWYLEEPLEDAEQLPELSAELHQLTLDNINSLVESLNLRE